MRRSAITARTFVTRHESRRRPPARFAAGVGARTQIARGSHADRTRIARGSHADRTRIALRRGGVAGGVADGVAGGVADGEA